MPMGIVSDSDFLSERDKLEPVREDSNQGVKKPTIPISPNAIITDINRGRGEGNVEVPDSLRNVIGQTATDYGRQESVELAKSFGISPSSASAYANGATSTATYNDRPNAGLIQRSKDRISKRARAKLMLALSHLTDEKLKDAKPRDLAGIARDMSTVVRGMEEDSANKNPLGDKQGPTFVFYSPQFFKEEKFEKVVAKE